MEEKMKAAILYAPGDLKVEDTKIPHTHKEDNVLLKVKAAGICGSDLPRILHTGTYRMPLIPGHEFSGEVYKVGEGVNKFKAGDRVVAAPILPCYKCVHCLRGNYGQCDDYNYLGSRCNGAFAEYVVVPEKNLVKLPKEISFAEGAVVEPAAVTLHGIIKIDIQPGDTIAVLGCGTIGLFAIQFAKIMGATKVIAVDIRDDKINFAKKAGADIAINAIDKDAGQEILKLTDGFGTDVVVETAGNSVTQKQAICFVKKNGKVLYLGTAHNDVVLTPQIFETIVRNEINIQGSWNSYSAPFPGNEWTATLNYLQTGRLNIADYITMEIYLEDLPQTIQDMADQKISYNKVVVSMTT